MTSVVYEAMYSDPSTAQSIRVAVKVTLIVALYGLLHIAVSLYINSPVNSLVTLMKNTKVLHIDGMRNNWMPVFSEISVFSGLQHPNIVRLYGVGNAFFVLFSIAALLLSGYRLLPLLKLHL